MVLPEESENKERIRYVISKYNEKRGTRDDVPLEKAESPEANSKDQSKNSQCLLRNVMEGADPRRISYSEIDLWKGALLDLIAEALANDPLNKLSPGASQAHFASPFADLVHNWDNLIYEAEAVDTQDTAERKQARSDLRKVLDFVQNSPRLEPYFKTRSANRSAGIVTYDHLWTIYRIGTEVIVTSFPEETQIMKVVDPPYLYKEEKSQSMLCRYYDHDGSNWVVAIVEFEIERFNGTKPIGNLPCIPLEYYKDRGEETDPVELRNNMIDRGKNFEKFCSASPGVQQMFHYDGPVLSVEKPFRSQYSSDSTVCPFLTVSVPSLKFANTLGRSKYLSVQWRTKR